LILLEKYKVVGKLLKPGEEATNYEELNTGGEAAAEIKKEL